MIFTIVMIYWILGWWNVALWMEALAPKDVQGQAWVVSSFAKVLRDVGVGWLVLFVAFSLLSSLP